MRRLLYVSFLLLLASITFAQKDILVNWECNMEIERLSGRFDPATDTVQVKGDFNGWSNPGHILDQSINPDVYVSAIPDTIFGAEVGVRSCSIPITLYRFGIESGINPKVLGNTIENPASNPQLI